MEIAAFHFGALGDLVVTIPALRAARGVAGPRTRVVLFAAGAGRGDLLRRGGVVHEALDLGRADLAPLFLAGGKPPGWLAERLPRFGAVYLFLRGAASVGENLRQAGVERVVEIEPRPPEREPAPAAPRHPGFEPAERREHVVDWLLRGVALSATYASDGPDGRANRIARRLEAPGPGGATARRAPRLAIGARFREQAAADLRDLGVEPGRGLALHPGSGGAAKCWPAPRFLELAGAAREAGFAPFFVLGPVECESRPDLLEAVEASGFPALREPPLPLLAAAVRVAGSFVGNDGGASHLAAAAGARTVAIFGPSDPAVWAPRGRDVRVLVAPHGDLGGLPPEVVLDALGGAPMSRS
jgi:hypothetical protein